jgi:hypothetical protein
MAAMSADPCSEPVRELLAEAALGVLAEPERGEVLAHAASCPSCGRALDELVHVSDRLVALAPEAEPPPGFEQRVLVRVGAIDDGRRRLPRWIPAAAAVVLLVVGVGVGLLLAPPGDGIAGFEQAELRTAEGTVVGELLLAGDRDRAVVLRLDHYREGVAYRCQLVLADGSVLDVGRWQPDEGSEARWWAATVETTGSVVEARMLAPDGSIWADGRLS